MRAKKKLGQHFLEPAWADKLVEAIAPEPGDRFLEIGPGPGALTLRLADRVERLTAVELDATMVEALAPKVRSNVDLVHQDFLEFDLRAFGAAGPLRVAGNLPYNVSSPILFRLIKAFRGGTPLIDATLMLQHEVAERIEAVPETRDYGVMSILIQRHADVRRLLTLPPGAFRPAPKVRSAVIRLTFRPPESPADEDVLEGMVRSMFTQRRKTLANALRLFAEARSSATGGATAEGVLVATGVDPRRRPETLRAHELATLARAFAGEFPSTANVQPPTPK
jgi:16S rRNA (adenine1518-N6/adenine1519-N6)-dimethyltransferase